MLKQIMKIVKKYKWWIILGVFAAVRVVVFSTFWVASANKGGWTNFYDQAQHAKYTLMGTFHHFCDWHPPAYFAITSALLHATKTQWSIYAFQIICALVSVYLTYLISRTYFSKRVSLVAAFMMAVEPFFAWHNFLLMTDNLFAPLFLAGFYFWFRFMKDGKYSSVAISAVVFAVATLVRPNSLLLTLFLSVLMVLIFVFRNKLKLAEYLVVDKIKLFYCLLVFNAIFFASLAPWVIRNKLVYDRLTIANIMSTNFYYYNLPPFVSWKEGVSYQEAYDKFAKQADKDLGKHVGSSRFDCTLFTNEELNRQLDYYKREANKVMLGNLPSYAVLHLMRTLPFFLQPGYFEMYSAYTGEFSKPDLSAALMKGNMVEIKNFLKTMDAKIIIYLIGVILWAVLSFVAFASLLYSYFKDRDKFLFALFAVAVIIYNALLISPFVIARYRIPLYPFFFILAAYFFMSALPHIVKRITIKRASDKNV